MCIKVKFKKRVGLICFHKMKAYNAFFTNSLVWTLNYSTSSKAKNVQKMTEMGRYMDVSVQPARKVSEESVRQEKKAMHSWYEMFTIVGVLFCLFLFFLRYAFRRWCLRRRWRTSFSTGRCEWSESTVSAPQIHHLTLHSAPIWRWVRSKII